MSQLASTGLCGLMLAIVGYLYIKKDRELREALERHAEETAELVKQHALELKEARDRHASDLRQESDKRIEDSNRLNKMALDIQREVSATIKTLGEMFEWLRQEIRRRGHTRQDKEDDDERQSRP